MAVPVPESKSKIKLITASAVLVAGCIALIYLYFFLLLPQSWSLNNDYTWLVKFNADSRFWPNFDRILKWQLSEGRFFPVWYAYICSLYRWLPHEPVYFRGAQFFMLGFTLTFLSAAIRKCGVTWFQVCLAGLLFLANLSMKDWLTNVASAEVVATTFFAVSIYFYMKGAKLLSAVAFVIMILSKESFFVLSSCFVLMEFMNRRGARESLKRPLLTSLLFLVPTVIFVLFVSRLPRVYTAGKFSNFSALTLIEAFVIPPLKSFFPAVILGVWAVFQRRSYTEKEKMLLTCGIATAVSMTVILWAWGPFDSWFYLHIVIPLGWAMALSSLISPDLFEVKKPVATGLLFLTYVYVILAVLNGSFNRWTDFNDARKVAEIACRDSNADAKLKIFTNCEEGSDELRNYLIAYNVCPNPPLIQWTNRNPVHAESDSEYLVTPACYGSQPSEAPLSQIKFRSWSILKFQ